MDSPAVLDAAAILAVLFGERGSEAVLPHLQGGLFSAVNLSEVHSLLLRRGVEADFAWRRVLSLGCEVCPYDDRQARQAAELIPVTRALSLSFGDRACLALALTRKATVYTTNSAWKSLDLGLAIEVIG